MFGLFFAPKPPIDYRAWKRSDYTFYDKMAYHLHDMGIICEPDSREPWFMCEAHDQSCLDDTLRAVEAAVDLTLEQVKGEATASRPTTPSSPAAATTASSRPAISRKRD